MPRKPLATRAYNFPGFRARSKVRGLFGDRMAVVVVLERRQKKQLVAVVGVSLAAGTTSAFASSATCRPETVASSWSCPSDESIAPFATP
jgi:hypothetical protein